MGCSTVPYWCTIDVRTPWARHGVPTGPPGPRRAPTDPRRTAGGTVGLRLIGASPVWAARSSYWRSRGCLFRVTRRSVGTLQSSVDCSRRRLVLLGTTHGPQNELKVCQIGWAPNWGGSALVDACSGSGSGSASEEAVAPSDPWQTTGGTVGPRLIGASPVWAARSS